MPAGRVGTARRQVGDQSLCRFKHHRRVHEELVAAWLRVFDACADLPVRPSPQRVQAMHLALWGGRRYALLLELDETQARGWAAEMERMCCLLLQDGPLAQARG